MINGLEKIGFTVRGLLGEGTEASGNMFQISNQMSIGTTEADIVGRLMQVVEEVAQHEEHARSRLLEGRRLFLLDQVGRALGILLHARVLSSKEATELLSGVRLGVEMGLIANVDVAMTNQALLLTQPGHLQQINGRALTSEQRDEVRAKMISVQLAKGRLRE